MPDGHCLQICAVLLDVFLKQFLLQAAGLGLVWFLRQLVWLLEVVLKGVGRGKGLCLGVGVVLGGLGPVQLEPLWLLEQPVCPVGGLALVGL